MKAVGQRIPNIDALNKATGKAVYFSDMILQGMLWGKLLRSPIAHGRIVRMDAGKARQVPGVVYVLTAEDCPDIQWGPFIRDQYILPKDGRVRFVGDEVAAVAATTYEAACQACELIEVEYEEYPAILDMHDSRKPGAPLIHPGGNVATVMDFGDGDMAAAWQEAAYVVEDTFSVPVVCQCPIETVSCLAEAFPDGHLNLYLPCQMPYNERMLMAMSLGIEEKDIRIIHTFIGGSFGGKIHHKDYCVAAMLSVKTGAPVKMHDTRQEAFRNMYPRLQMECRIKLGVSQDGRFVAKEMELLADDGAYNDEGTIILSCAVDVMDNVYKIENLHTHATLVYTNKVPSGAYRGFGNPQTAYAFECIIDEAAEKMGWDPAALRRQNVIGPNSVTIHGWNVRTCGLKECIDACIAHSRWTERRGSHADHRYLRGVGMACCVHKSGAKRHFAYEGSSALLRIDGSGRAAISCGEVELGQGPRTLWAQVVSERLGIPLRDIAVNHVDMNITPYGIGTFASRVSTLSCRALIAACDDAARQLKEEAALVFGVQPHQVTFEEGRLWPEGGEDQAKSLPEIVQQAEWRRAGLPITAQGYFVSPGVVWADENCHGNLSTSYSFAVHTAEVEIDKETGLVRVVDYVAAHDLGKALNPLMAEGQVAGGVAQGMGYALTEKLCFNERGEVLNDNFVDYKIQTFPDMPPIKTVFIETDDPMGPYGAKSIGEPALVPVAPAIANAVANALGARIGDLPITQEKVFALLQEKLKGEDAR